MDFIRKDIHTSILKSSKYSQLTIDDDFNIPDTKEDIDKIIAGNGYIVLDEVVAEEARVRVTGSVFFKAIYKTVGEKPGIEYYEGEIPFEDHVNVDGCNRSNRAESKCRLEDITVSMINSRKLEVRGLIGDGVSVYEDSGADCATDLTNGQGIECLYKDIVMTDLAIAKNDLFKIREEIEIQDSKPNIKEICWSSVDLRNMEIKALDNKISVRGELEIFVIYKGNEEHLPIQYLYSVRTIAREIDCQGAKEEMIIETECTMGKGDVNIRQDADGEDRIIAVDYSVNMNIKLYEDKEFRLLSDMYSPQAEIKPNMKELCYENLVMRNSAKAKVNHRHRMGSDSDKILQVCHVFGSVDVDDIAIHEEAIHLTGVIKTNVLYISSGDEPMSCMHVDIPFEYNVDTNPLPDDASVRIVPSLDMLSASLLNSEEIEIKAQVNLGISIFTRTDINVITDAVIEDIDYEKKAAMPGIVGYVVKNGDTIWSIARKYYATTESIRTINNLESDNIREGDRLIIVKS